MSLRAPAGLACVFLFAVAVGGQSLTGTYYMGTPGGGVWKTVNDGVTWTPIFDSEHVASIGAVAVAPSSPNIVYVGTGDVSNVGGAVNQGKGIYKSVPKRGVH